MTAERITFSFGKNWSDYVEGVDDEDVRRAKADIENWLGAGYVQGRRVLDVGSGSGIHSLSYVLLGAKEVYSFDYDPLSVAATKKLKEKAKDPAHWTVTQGSVLDQTFLESLGRYDIVYSWGVLHHTGSMWKAIENVLDLVTPGGTLWITLYKGGPRYPKDLAVKRRYNAASKLGKRLMEARRILRLMLRRARRFQNPFAWNEKVGRGMNTYHDIVDWFGGLPYEVATEDEVLVFARKHGFVLERISAAPEGGCSGYVLRRAKELTV